MCDITNCLSVWCLYFQKWYVALYRVGQRKLHTAFFAITYSQSFFIIFGTKGWTELIWFGSRTALSKMSADRSVTVGSVDVQPTDIVRNLGGHIAAVCLSLHPKSARLLWLTSLRTTVVDYRSTSAHAERRCATRSGLVATWPRQFRTPDITLAAHLLPDPVQDRAAYVQSTRWPVPRVHQEHCCTCCQ